MGLRTDFVVVVRYIEEYRHAVFCLEIAGN